MTITNLLEDFSAFKKINFHDPTSDDDGFDLVRLEGFDAGYKAGWDDATAAVKANSTIISDAISKNLSNLTFTYHDARTAVLNELGPIIKELTQSVLPKVLHSSLSDIIVETIDGIADRNSCPTVHLKVHPDQLESLGKILATRIDMPFDIIADPTLHKSTTLLEVGKSELEIDFTQYFEKISQTLTTFFSESEAVRKYG